MKPAENAFHEDIQLIIKCVNPKRSDDNSEDEEDDEEDDMDD
jgi:hypothetical protein